MQITDIITAPWAIVPEKLFEIQAIYATHACGEKIDISAVEARLGKPLVNDNQSEVVKRRKTWIQELEAGRNPIDDAEMEVLRNE